MSSTTIYRRYAKAGEVPPPDAKRYVSSHGYVRLRWTESPCHYVEAWEHRVVAEAPEGTHVHHLNGDKQDNRRENLLVMSAEEHATHHSGARWKINRQQMRQMYEQGLSTPEIGRRLGCNSVTVYRGLKKMGVEMRSRSDVVRRSDVNPDEVRSLALEGVSQAEIARRLGVSAEPIRRIYRELDLPRLSPGRQAV